jgi:hypothetical protein
MIGSAGLLLLAALARAGGDGETLCLTVARAAETANYPVARGELLHIAFTNSVYGSRVEERFLFKPRSFQAVDILYSEPRLAEFYGFESASREGDRWVARTAGREFLTLALRASRDSIIHISFRHHTISLNDGAARLSLRSCQRATHG